MRPAALAKRHPAQPPSSPRLTSPYSPTAAARQRARPAQRPACNHGSHGSHGNHDCQGCRAAAPSQRHSPHCLKETTRWHPDAQAMRPLPAPPHRPARSPPQRARPAQRHACNHGSHSNHDCQGCHTAAPSQRHSPHRLKKTARWPPDAQARHPRLRCHTGQPAARPSAPGPRNAPPATTAATAITTVRAAAPLRQASATHPTA